MCRHTTHCQPVPNASKTKVVIVAASNIHMLNAHTSCTSATVVKNVGHLSKVCRFKGMDKIPRNKFVSSDADEDHNEHVNHSSPSKGRNEPYLTRLLVEGKPVPFEIDTGASMSLMSEQSLYNISGKKKIMLGPCSTALRTYTGQQIPVRGQAIVHVVHNKNSALLPIIVVGGKGPNLLGRNWIRELEMETSVLVNHVSENVSCNAEVERFPNLFKDDLGRVKSFPVTLHVEEGCKPKFYKARTVPYALKRKVDMELQRLEDEGIIEPVKHSAWAAPIVPVLKPDGTVRVCGDYKITVNTVAKADIYPLPRFEELFAKVAGGKSFTKLDLTHAYQQLPLSDESKDLTTINTQRGLFRYNRLPFGVSAAPAIFQRTMDCLLQDIPQVAVFLDGILVTGDTDENQVLHLREVLSRLDAEGFRLKKEKCEFMLPEVTYLGHRITAQGIQPTTDKVRAVQDAPAPQNATELKSFLGLVNFYGKFLPHLSTVLSPLNSLLRKGVAFNWGEKQSSAFKKVKAMLASTELLAHFNPELEVSLSCDASSVGLGAVLAHKYPNGTERPIAFASRSLNKAEQRYSNIEREALAVTFGVKKFRDYIFGRHFWLYSDHKPLMTLFNEHKPIPSEVSPRIQKWAMQLSAYNYTFCYKPSSCMTHADALSRLPTPTTSSEVEAPEEFILLMDHLNTIPVSAADIQKATDRDPVLSRVGQYTLSGWPSHLPKQFQIALKQYKVHETEFSVENGCVLFRTRVVVPQSCKRAMLDELHSCHPGINKMKSLARSYVWWPGINQDIERTVCECDACQQVRHMPEKAPLHPWEWPEKPWSRIHVDFAGPFMGHLFLVVVDSHSKWTEVRMMTKITAEKTTSSLRELFGTHGLPDTIVSDNGPTFTCSDFKRFVQENGIRHVLVTPYHPASNGLAERAVQTFKESMKKMSAKLPIHQKLSLFHLNQHTTPHTTTGVPPAELLMRRSLRTRLDLARPDLSRKVADAQAKQKHYHDRSVKDRDFVVGDRVYARNYSSGQAWLQGTVVDLSGPLSFKVRLPDGRVIRRHLDQLRRCWLAENETNPFLPMKPDPAIPFEEPSCIVLPQPLVPAGSAPTAPYSPLQDCTSRAFHDSPKRGPPPGDLAPADVPDRGFNPCQQPEVPCLPTATFSQPASTLANRPRRERKPPDRLNL
ncbi:hypothetical protein BsWGS_28870 [Bradybaena similaris]